MAGSAMPSGRHSTRPWPISDAASPMVPVTMMRRVSRAVFSLIWPRIRVPEGRVSRRKVSTEGLPFTFCGSTRRPSISDSTVQETGTDHRDLEMVRQSRLEIPQGQRARAAAQTPSSRSRPITLPRTLT